MVFYSERNTMISFVFWATIGILIWSVFYLHADVGSTVGFYVYSILMMACAALMAYSWFATYYQIDGETLSYRSGVLNGKININEIRWVKLNQTKWVGYRPALALNGVIIRYKTYSEIYFSPMHKERFVEELKKINSKIEIIEA